MSEMKANKPGAQVLIVDDSVKNVESYRDRIREKLDLHDGTKLAHYASQWVQEHG